jgi:glycine/D-amino acid oxidase-like deaminating enzyme
MSKFDNDPLLCNRARRGAKTMACRDNRAALAMTRAARDLGYSGHGTQMSVWMGRLMADLLAEKQTENPWQRAWPEVA